MSLIGFFRCTPGNRNASARLATTLLQETSLGTAALTSTHAIEILVQIQDLPYIHKPLLEPQGHDVSIQLRPQKPLPLPLLVVLVLGIHVLGPPRTRPRRLRRRPAPRPVKVGRGVRRQRHLVHFGPARGGGEVVEPAGEVGIEGVGSRHGGALAHARTGLLGPAVDDAAAAADAGVVAALAAVGGVAGAHGEGAVAVVVVVVVEVGRVASADVAAGTAGSEGGTAVAGVDGSVHCSCGGKKQRSGGGGDVAVGDCW